jgi:hypothetical protein
LAPTKMHHDCLSTQLQGTGTARPSLVPTKWSAGSHLIGRCALTDPSGLLSPSASAFRLQSSLQPRRLSQAMPLKGCYRTLGRWCPSSSTPSSSVTCLVPPHGVGVHSLRDSLMAADSSGRRLRSDAEKGRPGLSPARHTGCCSTSQCLHLTLT